MKALVTGIAGFVGSYLAEELLANGHEVAGILLPDHPLENIEGVEDKIEKIYADISDLSALKEAINSFAPDVVFHLAAISFVPEAEGAPRKVFEVNLLGTANLLEAISSMASPASLIFVSTSEIYEPAEVAFVEEMFAKPRNFYAASKYAAELCVENYRNIKSCIFRPFNHIGPRQRADFLVSSIARQIALIEKENKDAVLEVGNVEVSRDFTDVRDIVRAYRTAAENKIVGTYNLCSGTSTKIRKIIDIFKSLAKVEFEVHIKKELFRQSETLKSFGSYEKAKKTFGWEPKIPLQKSLADTLDFWRERV